MIVVDTNLIGYLYLQSPYSPMAEQALRKDAEWAAPMLWRSEFCNVLALYIRKRFLTLVECQQVLSGALQLMHTHEYDVAYDRILRLAAASHCSAYDCEFVALAQDLGAALVTVDKQILKDFPSVAVSLADFTA